jgi:hypothetical protein
MVEVGYALGVEAREYPQVILDVIDLLSDRCTWVFPNTRNAVRFRGGRERIVFAFGKELHS